MKNKILEMLKLQDKMNNSVNPDWRTSNYTWTDAIMMEAMEAIEHEGTWKWWKKQEPNIEQAKMELVDIWHFALSNAMVATRDDMTLEQLADDLATHIKKEQWQSEIHISFVDYMRQVVATAANGAFSAPSFFLAMHKIGLSFDDLYIQYIAKNCLNLFRQANGYKEGTYIKIWGLEEDNVHLTRFLHTHPEIQGDNFYQDLYQLLTDDYYYYSGK